MSESSVLQILKRKETDRFQVSYVQNNRSGRREIVLLGKGAGKHRAEHTKVNILDASGKLIESRPIDDQIADFILNHFEARGDTESFSIYQEDLTSGKLNRHRERVAPDAVRHKLTTEEKTFTATGAKLWYHKPVFDKFRDTGFGSIIRATLTNHQVCSSRCQFCSTISRNKKDSVTLDEAIAFIDTLYHEQARINRERFPEYNEAYRKATGSDIRLRGLILSGGGQPNLWPHFAEFVEYLATLDIDLGLITNGFPPKISESTYKHFKWIRISVTPEDASPFYPGGRFDKQYLPETIKHNPDITVGYSYVFGPWTTDDIIQRIATSMDENGFNYCRTLTDCNLSREMQLLAHRELAERLHRLGFVDKAGNPTGRIFHQLKYHGTVAEAEELWDKGQCYLQPYNVFWDTTGHEENGHSYCYACDSVTVLVDSDEDGTVSTSERKFNSSKWGTVKNTDVHRLFSEPVQPFFDPRKICTSCLFMRNNRTVKEILTAPPDAVGPDLTGIDHVNFP
ncbi:MAG: radical SAM protein [Rhodospirillaceae bacterium]|nr:radical SAM protein [Rhodospirillaceae bacterium]